MKKINIYTDGSCSGNPGPGGWGAILKYKDVEKEISGGNSNTTNNRMELTAVIEALKLLKEPCDITITTDSSYIVKAFNEGWLDNWIKNNWKKSDKSPVLNRDLWETLMNLLCSHKYVFEWIKGHNCHPENERCDKLATDETKKFSI